MREVHYVQLFSNAHLELILAGWEQHHSLFADGEILVKMVRCI